MCSPIVVVLEWPWSTHLSLPSSMAAWQRLQSTLQGERKKIFELQVRSTVCSCLQELTPGVNNSSGEPHQILARCLWTFCFGHHTLYQSVLQSKMHQSPNYGLQILEVHILSLFNRSSALPLPPRPLLTRSFSQ